MVSREARRTLVAIGTRSDVALTRDATAGVNGAEVICQNVSPSPSEDRSNGWLAQPLTDLFVDIPPALKRGENVNR
ncbi:hypothetical protein GCM10009021_27590 [Halarchaeum nitratireducens]|uniref:Uncharacterized protein n=1 Tax=Halarchaeum nitratireducens TaxID=489913 RepID=A0A830GGA5_9EURY|nr:hypothetical protein GCM10009021_27590 [Halarchaeum nitratireducens]